MINLFNGKNGFFKIHILETFTNLASTPEQISEELNFHINIIYLINEDRHGRLDMRSAAWLAVLPMKQMHLF